MTIASALEAREAELAGRFWWGMFRRNGPAYLASRWTDMSYAAGNPVANYYASAPLTAASLLGREGIDTGPAPEPGMRKRISTFTMLPGTPGGVRQFQVLDYCLYYPFVDGDGGAQPLDNSITIPRYGGEGCQVMAVCQGTGLSTGEVLLTYTNSDGISGRQATTTLDMTVTPGTLASSLAPAVAHANPAGPWMRLQHGDTGVLRIDQVECLNAMGGIFALVIAYPLLAFGSPGLLGEPLEVDPAAEKLVNRDFDHGAYVNVISWANAAGTPALLGAMKTIWG